MLEEIVIRGAIWLAVSFNTHPGTSSGHVVLSELSSLSCLAMPIVPITRSLMAENDLCLGVERIPW